MNVSFDSKCCLYFFASPKKYQKRRPENDVHRVFGGASIWLLHYCGEQQRFPDRFLNGNISFVNRATGYDILNNSKYYSNEKTDS